MTFLLTWRSAGTLICLSVVLLVAIGNDVLVDGRPRARWIDQIRRGLEHLTSGTLWRLYGCHFGIKYDVVLVLDRCNGGKSLESSCQQIFNIFRVYVLAYMFLNMFQ